MLLARAHRCPGRAGAEAFDPIGPQMVTPSWARLASCRGPPPRGVLAAGAEASVVLRAVAVRMTFHAICCRRAIGRGAPTLVPVRSPDTSREARMVQLAVYRRMTGGQRVALAIEMSEAAGSISRAGAETRAGQGSHTGR